MASSPNRILTTHVGSLPRPDYLLPTLYAKTREDAFDAEEHQKVLHRSIAEVVEKQVKAGVDIVNDGEHGKSTFSAYTHLRLGGLEPWERTGGGHRDRTRDSIAFPGVYKQIAENAARIRKERGKPSAQPRRCVAPIVYKGKAEVEKDIAELKAALKGRNVSDAFITALSPSNVEMQNKNDYYKTQEEFLFALADAMHVEYKAIVDAGFQLQIDDPRLATFYDRSPDLSLEDCRKFIAVRVEAVNHALRGIPAERVRFHTCYSVNVAPRVHDMELKDFIDLMLKIKAGQFSFEAANPRHEHEWVVWKDVKLAPGTKLLPGVISHCVYQVEHPELVAQRIERFANVVGRENVIASNDCGFATAADGDEVHPEVAWAKLDALVEGAAIASKRLWAK
jgi:5-methyltetrahydropteroyltriglutamate--homocysteine methyltransferase